MTDTPSVPRKATWRLGARQRERLQWAVVAVICVLLFFAFRPYYYYILETRDFQTCRSNMLQIAGALGRYKADWDDTLPQGPIWQDTLGAYLSPRTGTGFKVDAVFHCPRDKSRSPSSYAWNSLFDGYSESQRSLDPVAEANRALLGRADRVPMLIEAHGSERNNTLRLLGWDDVIDKYTTPHFINGSYTGVMILGGMNPTQLSKEKAANRRGITFKGK